MNESSGFSTDQKHNLLRDNWFIQSSNKVRENGEKISKSDFDPQGWYPVTMPSTVLASLVKKGVLGYPYFGTNIKSIPGYREGQWVDKNMPKNSPFNSSWWYRTEFELPGDHKRIWLHLHGINYRANVWLNGHNIADSSTVENPYRLFEFDTTDWVLPGKNVLALEIFPPKGMDLSISWVDWNPTPPDVGTGIWYDVYITTTGPVRIRDPRIITDLFSLEKAHLTVSAEMVNTSSQPLEGTLRGEITDVNNLSTSDGTDNTVSFSQNVKLDPKESRLITFSPENFTQLNISDPRLWWPSGLGSQDLYDLRLKFRIEHETSDIKNIRFGIRKVTSHLSDHGNRIFQINGKNVLIRGAGYVEDMMLRPFKERDEAEINYVRHMNLNALRMEGIRGSDHLYDLCDKHGIITFVGLCCCCSWEKWEKWERPEKWGTQKKNKAEIAEKSLKDQVIRLRNHPSVVDWLYGSDKYPPADIERRYMNVLDTYDGTRPYQSSATDEKSELAEPTGLSMGPFPDVYAYEPPSYWYKKLEFNTEAGPGGGQIPPIESMRRMMPKDELWPMSTSWFLRVHPNFFPQSNEALNARYGKPAGVEEYCVKSQVFNFEAVRAMFEAYARNKYDSSGIIYWMLNSAWPTLYWQLYDYYLLPNGAFYAARKACEPLHVQYSYDDCSVCVVNGYHQNFKNLKVTAKVYNFDMNEKYHKSATLDVLPDSVNRAFNIDWPGDLTRIHFLKLELKDETDKLISSNFYWLSTNADFTQLMSLPPVDLGVSCTLKKRMGVCTVYADLKNASPDLAFAINPKIKKIRSREMVLPVYWEDNYFSLLPGESRRLYAKFDEKGGEEPLLILDGWNIKTVILHCPIIVGDPA